MREFIYKNIEAYDVKMTKPQARQIENQIENWAKKNAHHLMFSDSLTWKIVFEQVNSLGMINCWIRFRASDVDTYWIGTGTDKTVIMSLFRALKNLVKKQDRSSTAKHYWIKNSGNSKYKENIQAAS